MNYLLVAQDFIRIPVGQFSVGDNSPWHHALFDAQADRAGWLAKMAERNT